MKTVAMVTKRFLFHDHRLRRYEDGCHGNQTHFIQFSFITEFRPFSSSALDWFHLSLDLVQKRQIPFTLSESLFFI